jgi:hypothetical protein
LAEEKGKDKTVARFARIKLKEMKIMFRAMMAAVAITTLVGCASVPVSPQRVQASESAIQDAVAAGAERDPSAAKYLKLARGELASGKQLSDSGSVKQAETMLERSEADAKLASATQLQSASAADVKRVADELKTIAEGSR